MVITLKGLGGMMSMNAANIITTSRIILIPIFIYFFFADFPGHYYWAGGIFVISGITDFLDGYIARTHNLTSNVGRLLDPLADKLSMISAFISIAIVNLLPLWIISIILFREIAILSGSIYVYFTGQDIIFPSKFGKFATFCLYSAAAASILGLKYIGAIFIAFAMPSTLISAIDYVVKAYHHFFKS